MPKWAKDHYDYETDRFPAKENTAKMCSIALHKLFKLYNDDELFKGYWNFGEKHFARTTDDKTLSQLREEQRPHVW
jgi:hypothetical protein